VLGPAECQTAAGMAARPYGGAVIVGGLPPGCVWFTAGAGSFFFNNQVGIGSVYAQPVCAGAPDSECGRQHDPGDSVCERVGARVQVVCILYKKYVYILAYL
jgi:hypothetical protein